LPGAVAGDCHAAILPRSTIGLATTPDSTTACPVAATAPVLVDFGDGRNYLGLAGDFDWRSDSEGRVLGYTMLAPADGAPLPGRIVLA